jgi:hypothetical protein
MSPPSSRSQNEPRKKPAWNHWASKRTVPPKCRLTFNGLHSVISQKISLFITTGVRASNPTFWTLTSFPCFCQYHLMLLVLLKLFPSRGHIHIIIILLSGNWRLLLFRLGLILRSSSQPLSSRDESPVSDLEAPHASPSRPAWRGCPYRHSSSSSTFSSLSNVKKKLEILFKIYCYVTLPSTPRSLKCLFRPGFSEL